MVNGRIGRGPWRPVCPLSSSRAAIAILAAVASARGPRRTGGPEGGATAMILPITLTMVAACVLLNVWLARRVGQMRHAHKVSIGDGNVEPLTARMRAQANFVEWAPFFLILVGAIELAEGQPIWLWAVAVLFIVVRIVHAFGM